MTTTHLRDPAGQPVGTLEVESRDDVSAAVVDDLGGSHVVSIEAGGLHCRACRPPECEHTRAVASMLADLGVGREADADG